MDVGKDAMIPFEEGYLSNSIHGPYIRDIISYLFRIEDLSPSDKQHVVGVGDKKEILKKRIEAALRLNDYKPVPIARLSFSGTGQDFRPTGFFLAQDAGIGMDKISSDYTLVVTPGSVLDAAGKKKRHKNIIDGLTTPSTLAEKILKSYDLFNALPSISYKGHKNNLYTFEAKTSLPSFSTVDFTFNNTFKETGGHFFEGNRVKNKYIYDNWQDPAKLSTITMYLLAKELQDTLQVAWLEDTIEKRKEINSEKVALCTNDMNVWLRCMVNNVPCIHSHGAEIKYYPVASTQAQKALRKKIAMQNIYEQLKKHNEDVIHNLRDFYQLVSEDGDLTLTNAPNEYISPKQRISLQVILSSVIRYIETKASDILKKFPQTIEDIRNGLDYIEIYKIKYPFLVNVKRKEIRHMTVFKSFFPNAVDKVLFRPEIIHNKILKRGDFSQADILNTLGDIPLVGGLLPISGGRAIYMKGGDIETQDDLHKILDKNRENPGFFTYFILKYIPEIPYIAYAYGMALGIPLDTYNMLFKSNYIDNISMLFGKPDHDYIFEYYGGDSHDMATTCDDRMYSLCGIAKNAYDMIDRSKTSNIFDYAYDEIEWFLNTMFDKLNGTKVADIRSSSVYTNRMSENGTPSIRSMSQSRTPSIRSISSIMSENGTPGDINKNIHGEALEKYHMLYEAELSLINMYKRDTMTPMDYISSKRKKGKRATKKRLGSRSRISNKLNKSKKFGKELSKPRKIYRSSTKTRTMRVR